MYITFMFPYVSQLLCNNDATPSSGTYTDVVSGFPSTDREREPEFTPFLYQKQEYDVAEKISSHHIESIYDQAYIYTLKYIISGFNY